MRAAKQINLINLSKGGKKNPKKYYVLQKMSTPNAMNYIHLIFHLEQIKADTQNTISHILLQNFRFKNIEPNAANLDPFSLNVACELAVYSSETVFTFALYM